MTGEAPPQHPPPAREEELPALGFVPSGRTRVFAVLGRPVGHSLSPRMQNAGLRALGLDGIYVALEASDSDLPGLLLGLARAGGGGNVTLPHKERAARTVEAPSERVVRTGACNTFWLEDGVVRGDNTDVTGVRRSVQRLVGGSVEGARVLLLGAGGAARAAAVALREEGVARVEILNRTADRAVELARALDDPGVVPLRTPPGPEERWDLVVNATRLGLSEADPLAIEPRAGVMGAILDLVYAPGSTALVARARSLDIPALDGTEMLLQQGMEAFRLWWGVPAPELPMREALGQEGDGGAASRGEGRREGGAAGPRSPRDIRP